MSGTAKVCLMKNTWKCIIICDIDFLEKIGGQHFNLIYLC